MRQRAVKTCKIGEMTKELSELTRKKVDTFFIKL